MEEYTPEQLIQTHKGLCTEIEKAIIAVIPHIHRHVADTLQGQPLGTIVVHSTFFRILDQDHQMYFIETQLKCMGRLDEDGATLNFRLHKVILHDSIQSYFDARHKCVMDSETKFGDSLRPISTEYNGMKINLN